MKSALIICGGEFSKFDLSLYENADFVIAADKGYEYCKKLKIQPDLIIGDFDSYNGKLPEKIESIILPHEKDDTDTMFCIKTALNKGFADITLVCALGNRFDHTFANIQSLNYIVENNGKAKILSENNQIYCIKNDKIILQKKDNYSFSVFALSDEIIISEKGTGYDLDHVKLTNSFPLGTSNEWKEDFAEITIHEGTALIVESAL